MAAIKEAKENMGDFKLKSAHDYVVPDHLRMNVDKARLRLVQLKEKVSILLLFVFQSALSILIYS